MKQHRTYLRPTLVLLAAILIALSLATPGLARADHGGSYQQINLVSDLAGVAQFQDANLVNAWGLSHSSTSPWWISDNGTGKSTLYNGSGVAAKLVVTIPHPSGGTPTGNVFNTLNSTNPNAFVVSEKGISGPSAFIFATEDGTIAGWNPTVDRANAIIAVDRSTVGDGAVYKGLTLGGDGEHPFLYATNFRFGTVEVFDTNFKLVRSFTDQQLAHDCPLPGQCFAPFGIQSIGERIYVTFALQDPDHHDDVGGPEHGFVDVFDGKGHMLHRLASHGALNSPWGLALAPDNFGPFSHALLVGNFGDGRINAYNPQTGKFLGRLSDNSGKPLTIDGLWGLAFGNGAQAGALDELFFTAGLNHEADGLFGKIQAINAPGDH